MVLWLSSLLNKTSNYIGFNVYVLYASVWVYIFKLIKGLEDIRIPFFIVHWNKNVLFFVLSPTQVHGKIKFEINYKHNQHDVSLIN